MNPLKTNKLVLTWFCVYPAEENESSIVTFARVLFSLGIVFGMVSAFIGSVVFFYRFILIDLESSLGALFQISAYLSTIYMIGVSAFMRRRLVAIIDELEMIYKASKFSTIVDIKFAQKMFINCVHK